jgi:hypothetical protein
MGLIQAIRGERPRCSVGNPQTAQGWLHSLELPQARRGARCQQRCSASRLEGAGLKPNRLERYMASDDPEFETKAADFLGLYLKARSIFPYTAEVRRG